MNKIEALAKHLGVDVSEIDAKMHNRFEVSDGSEYYVYTDEEANEEWETQLGQYLEECIYPELPETMRNYFDDERWKRDARFDGRGHSLSSYDGEEHEVRCEDGSYLFIYRTN